MLRIDDARWNQLKSNYSTGGTVARLLTEARAGAPLDRWYDSLFQELMHQYTLSEVAYAAVPHLVDIAKKRPETRKHLMVLVGACYAHSDDSGAPVLPSDFREEWRAARIAALPVTLGLLEDPRLNENDVRYLLSALAALKGQNRLSIAIEAQGTGIDCPECGSWIELAGLMVSG